jgi:hypothetical protein
MLKSEESWIGPYQVRFLLESCLEVDARHNPPDNPSAYFVSQFTWQSFPTIDCVPLYVGGITGDSPRFRTRIGDLLADAFGFYNHDNPRIGHSSGGQSIHSWCSKYHVVPLDLYIAWIGQTDCHRCLEFNLHCFWDAELRKAGRKLLNRRTPPECPDH